MKSLYEKPRRLALLFVVLASVQLAAPAQGGRDVSREPARASREWVRDGVVYEIFPRVFSAGNCVRITKTYGLRSSM